MPRFASAALLSCCFLAFAAHAITPAVPQEFTCPLTGERFVSYGGYGTFTSFGNALDLRQTPMGILTSYGPNLAKCADSALPLYKAFTPEEVEKLRVMVATPEWAKRREVGNDHYLVAYTRYVLGEGQQAVADALLSAVWSATSGNKSFLLGRAIEAFSRLADQPGPRSTEWVAASWLRVELNRQLGAFDQAAYWLQDFEIRTRPDPAPVTPAMIAQQRELIARRSSRVSAVYALFSHYDAVLPAPAPPR